MSHYLSVTVQGELTAESDAAIDVEILDACEAQGINLVPIDIRPAKTRLSLIENQFAARSFRQRMGAGIRATAIVDEVANRSRSEMYELTSVNRGARVRFFDQVRDAVNWLETLR